MNEVTNRLRKKLKQAAPDPFMGMSPVDLAIVREEAVTTNIEEGAALISCFETAAGSVLHDVSGVLADTLYIDDFSSPARRVRPLCLIERRLEGKVVVDVIDILETVRRNPLASGHPVILAAINKWQAIIRSSKVLLYRNVYDSDLAVKSLRKQLKGNFVLCAKRNLRAIADALIEGPSKKGISNKEALQLVMKSLNADSRDSYLYFAWLRLDRRFEKPDQDAEDRIDSIMTFLQQIRCASDVTNSTSSSHDSNEPFVANRSIKLHWVRDFLHSAGKCFVYSEATVLSRRPRWTQFRNAFLSWYYEKKINTLDKYRRIRAHRNSGSLLVNPNLFSSPQRESVWELISNQLITPLVRACPPIVKPGSKIDFDDLMDQINSTIAN